MALTDQDKKTLQVGLFIAGLILAGALVAKYQFFSITNRQLKSQITQIGAQIREQQALRNDLLALADRRDEIEAMAARIREASRRLPNSAEEGQFYRALTEIIGNTQFKWSDVHPAALRPHQLFTEMPYSVAATAGFHEFGQFMNLIEENPERFMRVSHINIHNDREHPTNHPVNFEITTFMLHNVPPAAEVTP
ncbi:MAG: type 4a pilus biogenesis protein PilO [Candidatus Sumerlaeia bacterium]|nr:type 4a pilus biogenesis protein PilO [Candidatus Sumerlaeia bacterium]